MSDQPTIFGPRELTPGSGGACRCTTCGDVAEAMIVLKVDVARELALCEDQGGEHHTVEIALIEDVADGEALLVHAGTAIARADVPA